MAGSEGKVLFSGCVGQAQGALTHIDLSHRAGFLVYSRVNSVHDGRGDGHPAEKQGKKQVKVFLSVFDVDAESIPQRKMQLVQDELEKGFAEKGVEWYDSGAFESYEKTFHQIVSADVLVALIDSGWTSSTWKLIELYFACGAGPGPEKRMIGKPLPCFVHDTSGNVNIVGLLTKGLILPFDGSVDDLLRQCASMDVD